MILRSSYYFFSVNNCLFYINYLDNFVLSYLDKNTYWYLFDTKEISINRMVNGSDNGPYYGWIKEKKYNL